MRPLYDQRKMDVFQVDLFIGPNQVIGLGTGPGCEYAIEHLGRKMKEGKLWNIKAIAV